MVFLTLLLIIRLMTLIWRVEANTYSKDDWVWYRVTTDLASYMLNVIFIILLAQWYQTYRVLSNPTAAI